VRDPDRHPHHAFEAEPHALIAPLGPGPLPGVGFRGTFTLSEDGFIAASTTASAWALASIGRATMRMCRW
jgi:hypothetical protein